MKPGVYPGLSFEEYCAIPAINKSGLDEIAVSPLHYYAKYLDPHREPENVTPAKVLGSAIHTMTLEPAEWPKRYMEEPENTPRRPTMIQRNAKNPSPETLESIRFWDEFEVKARGKTILTADQVKVCKKVGQTISKSNAARTLLSNGHAEVTIIWETVVVLEDGSEVQVPCKARLDYLTESAMLDVKSTELASPKGFSKSIANYAYHAQAAWYSDGFKIVTGQELPFVFLAFEKSAPYACGFYYADEKMIAMGRKLYRPLLETYAKCLKAGAWPGYPDEIRAISLPAWAEKEYLYDREI